MKRLLLFALLIVGCTTYRLQSEDDKDLYWPMYPIGVYVDDGVDRNTVLKVIKTWDRAYDKDLFYLTTSLAHSDVAVYMIDEDHWHGENDDNAVTMNRFHRNGRMFRSSVMIHKSKVNAGADLESLLLHEFGHVLGLAHSDNNKSVMFPSLAKGQIKREILPDDMDKFKIIRTTKDMYEPARGE